MTKNHWHDEELIKLLKQVAWGNVRALDIEIGKRMARRLLAAIEAGALD